MSTFLETAKALCTSASPAILEQRVYEHKTKAAKGFTSKYKVDQLLFFEEFDNIYEAQDAEKKIKGWVRKKKLELIRSVNPGFEDLSKSWYEI